MTEQETQLVRVTGSIGRHVVEFFTNLQTGDKFSADDITRYVRARAICSPSSVDRVMRDLRAKGVISYECVSRAESIYQFPTKTTPTT